MRMQLTMRLCLWQQCPDCGVNVGEHGSTYAHVIHTPECRRGQRNARRRERRRAQVLAQAADTSGNRGDRP